jgi:hypothetical protein
MRDASLDLVETKLLQVRRDQFRSLELSVPKFRILVNLVPELDDRGSVALHGLIDLLALGVCRDWTSGKEQ